MDNNKRYDYEDVRRILDESDREYTTEEYIEACILFAHPMNECEHLEVCFGEEAYEKYIAHNPEIRYPALDALRYYAAQEVRLARAEWEKKLGEIDTPSEDIFIPEHQDTTKLGDNNIFIPNTTATEGYVPRGMGTNRPHTGHFLAGKIRYNYE